MVTLILDNGLYSVVVVVVVFVVVVFCNYKTKTLLVSGKESMPLSTFSTELMEAS